MDTLYGEMKRRSSQRLEVNARFGFLTKIEFLMDSIKNEDIDSAIHLYSLLLTSTSLLKS